VSNSVDAALPISGRIIYSKSVKNAAWKMAPEAADPDLALIKAMAQGDSHALHQLYVRRGPGLLAYLTSRLGDRQWAEELLQDVMLAAWQAAAGFRQESRVHTWLLTIARNKAINAIQRDRSPPLTSMRSTELVNPGRVEADVARNEEVDRLQKGIGMLPEEQRETLELVFFHGLSGPETAAVMGVAPGTIKSRLNRAKARLRHWFEETE
jgi:RNA polymerase sigma-70 factor (ECF subfamily)